MTMPPEDDLPLPVAESSDNAPDAADGPEGEGPEGGPPDGEGGQRRRNRRRNRRKGPRAEGEGPAPEGGAPESPPPQADERFAEVLSGSFDVEADAPPEGEVAAEAEAHKRVLPPEPDAPKLHKVLAQAGIGSRREMEQMILEGRITVNGEPAHIGQRISFGDQVKVGGKPIRFRIVPPPPRVVAYHKPAGEIVTHDDPQNRPTVFRRLPRLAQGKWQSVGRLDINTEGLLLFTNSGGLANQLMHPRFGVEREYAVRVLGTLDDEARAKLIEGVEIDGQSCAFRRIDDGGGDGANRWYRVVITEGRNREVRRLFDAVGLTVSRLIRIRYGTVVLPHGLKRGMWVDLGESDVRAIRRLAGGGATPENGPPPPRAQDDDGGGAAKRRRRNRGGRGDDRPRDLQAGDAPPPEMREPQRERRDDDLDGDLDDHGPIPNPLEQTFDKRFVQKPRSGIGGRGFKHGGGGFGPGGSSPSTPRGGGGGGGGGNKGGPRQPDPMQTSVGYIGADAFHRKNRGGRGGGGGGGFGGGFGGGGSRGR